MTESLPLAVLDFVGIEHGESATDSIRGALGIARSVEAAGYGRYWVSEHHNMRSLACNGLRAVFAHHMSPDIALEALQAYRREFTSRRPGDAPYSAISVLTFASENPDDVDEFEAAWTLTMRNLARGIREPVRPEDVTALARSRTFRTIGRDDTRMIVGEPKAVAERLLELKEQAEVDELVLVTPSLDRNRRTASLVAVADAWRRAA